MLKKVFIIIILILIQYNIFSDSFRLVGTAICLDEKPSPPEIDYLDIKIDPNLVINISNSTLTILLDENIKQLFFEYINQGLEVINTIESENITIEFSSEIGTIDNNDTKILISFSTNGSIESTKLYIAIEKSGLSSINSLNKEHCEELINLLTEAENMIIDIQRQKDLLNSGSDN